MPSRPGDRITNKDRLEKLAVHQLPEGLQKRLERVRLAINDLKEEAGEWHVKREFTPDGRFLGDVGELIAKLYFGVELHIKQEKGSDATHAEVDAKTTDDRGHLVEVKLRSKATGIVFTGIPAIVLVIYFSPTNLKWGIVCNGPGKKLLATATSLPRNNYRTDCSKLIKAQATLDASTLRLKMREPVKPS